MRRTFGLDSSVIGWANPSILADFAGRPFAPRPLARRASPAPKAARWPHRRNHPICRLFDQKVSANLGSPPPFCPSKTPNGGPTTIPRFARVSWRESDKKQARFWSFSDHFGRFRLCRRPRTLRGPQALNTSLRLENPATVSCCRAHSELSDQEQRFNDQNRHFHHCQNQVQDVPFRHVLLLRLGANQATNRSTNRYLSIPICVLYSWRDLFGVRFRFEAFRSFKPNPRLLPRVLSFNWAKQSRAFLPAQRLSQSQRIQARDVNSSRRPALLCQ